MAEIKFSKRLTARVTEAEYNKVMDKISGTNITKSTFLRDAVLLNKTSVKEIDKEFQKRVLFLLSNISNNVNQIAHHTNIHKKFDSQILSKLNEILNVAKSTAEGVA